MDDGREGADGIGAQAGLRDTLCKGGSGQCKYTQYTYTSVLH